MYGTDDSFLADMNPDRQVQFGGNTKLAVTGDFPTLTEIDAAYGEGFAVEWTLAHITTLALYTGAKNLTTSQSVELARIITTEYRHLKVSELMLFFYRFKTGRYGRFYGTVDPMVITCALRDFMKERIALIDQYEQEERERREEEQRRLHPPVSWETFRKMKEDAG